MRIQLTMLLAFLSTSAYSVDEKSMQDLFSKYDSVMIGKKIELIDDVFSQKFIKESGGKSELIDKIKSLSVSDQKKIPSKAKMTWRKGLKEEIYFAQLKEESSNKVKKSESHSDFVIIMEEGKPRIDGTLSDGN